MTRLEKAKKHLKFMQAYTCKCGQPKCKECRFLHKDVPWLIAEVERLSPPPCGSDDVRICHFDRSKQTTGGQNET